MALQGKVAIVTGASRGIGRAMALGLAGIGAKVVIAARTEAPRRRVPGTIYSTAEEIEALGGAALPLACDVTDEESVNAMVAAALERFGRIDVLINNAGVGSYSPFLDTPISTWDQVLGVKVRGTVLCCRAVLPDMVQRRSGSVINVSSRAAEQIRTTTGSPTFIGQAYGAANAALERLSVGLGAEMKEHNVAVNALKPTRPVVTEGLKAQRPDADWSRWVGPEDMVKAALFLAQQEHSILTGAVVTDEGLVAKYDL